LHPQTYKGKKEKGGRKKKGKQNRLKLYLYPGRGKKGGEGSACPPILSDAREKRKKGRRKKEGKVSFGISLLNEQEKKKKEERGKGTLPTLCGFFFLTGFTDSLKKRGKKEDRRNRGKKVSVALFIKKGEGKKSRAVLQRLSNIRKLLIR